MTFELAPWLAAWVAVLSVADFVLAGFDKRRATRGGPRVPERNLLGLALLGGSPGLLLGMLAFRHKTRKASFLARFALVIAAQGLVAWWLLRGF